MRRLPASMTRALARIAFSSVSFGASACTGTLSEMGAASGARRSSSATVFPTLPENEPISA